MQALRTLLPPQLFQDSQQSDTPKNVLPYDGEALYHGPIFPKDTADYYLEKLFKETPWKPDELIIYGKEFITDRKVAWYGTKKYEYTYSNKTRVAILFTPLLLEIKSQVEKITGVRYDTCLLNLYEHGDQGVGWHADEDALDADSSIASLSFGAERRFDFRHKETQETFSQHLAHGSMIVMQGVIQNYWKHQLPKTKKIKHPRVNLTFPRILK